MSEHIVKVPDLGEGIAEVELVAWHVKPGDTVAEDQALAEVMTDKASVEIPSPHAGTVLTLGGEVGQMLAVGGELLRIGLPDASAAMPAALHTTAASAPRTAEAPAHRLAPPVPAPPRPIATPAVRARAWELGIDLAAVEPTGTAGRVVQADLDAHLDTHPDAQIMRGGTGTAAARAVPLATGATHEIKLTGLRRRIAQRMQESKRRIPHFTYVEEVDVSELEELRAQLNARWKGQRVHLTLLPFLIRAIVLAVRGCPQVNARFDDDAGLLTRHDAVHLGIATQTDAGLMVPVLRDAATHDLWSGATELLRLAGLARAGRLTRDELAGSTITLTSLGKLGGIVSTPVINPPEVAIVGVNRIVMRPVMRDGLVIGRRLMNLSCSFDHRIVDGALAATFVQGLRQRLEHPATLFVD